MPLGVVVTGANANDGCQTEEVLHALVVQPPAAESPVPCLDLRSLPRAQADGAYGNGPTQERARRGGFCLPTPPPGQTQACGGTSRKALDRHCRYIVFNQLHGGLGRDDVKDAAGLEGGLVGHVGKQGLPGLAQPLGIDIDLVEHMWSDLAPTLFWVIRYDQPEVPADQF